MELPSDEIPDRLPQQSKPGHEVDKIHRPDPSLIKERVEKDMLFPKVNLAADEALPEIVESYCVACGGQGETRLLLTKIPFFREVVIMSFSCPECGFHESEVQYGGKIEPQGKKIEFKVLPGNVSRQVILSDFATYSIPELEFEAPQAKGHGVFTTIEGLLQKTMDSLEQDQPVRKIMEPELAVGVEKFIERLKACKEGAMPFTLIINDISGNSHVDNVHAPQVDPDVALTKYDRTPEMDAILGINAEAQQELQPAPLNEEGKDELDHDEILLLPSNCASCLMPVECRIKQLDIPHFKEVLVYATSCDHCGLRTNEIKSGGLTEEKGVRYILRLHAESDWRSRDVLKSPNCVMKIPEIQFESSPSALGGSFTTVEGLLQQAYDQLADNPFLQGDGSHTSDHRKLEDFLREFKHVIDGEKDCTLILEDCSGTSYVQNIYAPDPDPDLLVEHYERSFEENEELGLNDMKTENYALDTIAE